jgi:hypothetical protein
MKNILNFILTFLLLITMFLMSFGVGAFNNVDTQFLDNPVYNKNPGFEQGLSNYSRYADAAGTIPVDMTGGSPSITIALNGTTPIEGNKDLIITKDAANRQGNGISFPFTIPAGLQGNVLQACFNVRTSSAYADADAIFYLYDVTNAALIAPVTQNIMAYAASTGSNQQCFQFQAPINSTSLRGGIHISTTNASAYTITIDNFKVQKPKTVNGAAATNGTTYTPVITTNSGALTNYTATATYYQVGKFLQVSGTITMSGAVGTFGGINVGLPSGMVIDTAKLTSTAAYSPLPLSSGYLSQTGTVLQPAYKTTTTVVLAQLVTNSGSNPVYATVNNITQAAIATNDIISFNFQVPITGFNATAVLGQDAATQVISAKMYRKTSAQTALSNTALEIIPNTTVFDNLGLCNTTTGRCTANISGSYKFCYGANVTMGGTAASYLESYLLINGTGNFLGYDAIEVLTNSKSYQLKNCTEITLLQNQYVSLWVKSYGQNSSVNYNDTIELTYLSLERASGPASFIAPESAYIIPPGTGTLYYGATAPTGWLLENGTSYLRTDYPALYNAILCSIACADGTHFTVPTVTNGIIKY